MIGKKNYEEKNKYVFKSISRKLPRICNNCEPRAFPLWFLLEEILLNKVPLKMGIGWRAAQILQSIPTLRKKKLKKIKNLYFQRSQSTFKSCTFDSYLGPLLSRGDLLLFFNRDWPRCWPIEPQWFAIDEGNFGYSPITVASIKLFIHNSVFFFLFRSAEFF